jgi:molecular chaperone DnaJ
MDAAQDYYDILGVSRSATDKEIRQSYKRLARKYHPDVNPGDKAVEARFKGITEAYNVLSDPDKRKQYDQFGRAYQHAQQSGQWQGGDFDDFLRTVMAGGGGAVTFGGSFRDIFGDLFGRAGRPTPAPRARAKTPQPGEDIEHELEVTFDEAMLGAEKTISLALSDRCPECGGMGGKTSACSACGGTGRSRGRGRLQDMMAGCWECQGTGEVVTSKCPQCGGSGEVTRRRRIKVRVPPGIDTGRRVQVRGEGMTGERGGAAGNLLLRARVAPHPLFQRRGDDILVEVPLKFTEAALGAEIDVPSVWGKARLKVPPGTKSGQVLRLKGMGAPKMGRDDRGDELVKVAIAVPSRLSRHQRELLTEFDKGWTEDPRADLKV